MPMKMDTRMGDIDRYIEEKVSEMRSLIIRQLQIAGEQCVNAARNLPSMSRANPAASRPHQPNYIDDTAKLRSSIGYVVVCDGEVVFESSFAPVGGGKEGSEKGRAFAERLAREERDGFALIVVAGMNYARYVAAKGYDVLDTAELEARKLVPRLLRQIGIE